MSCRVFLIVQQPLVRLDACAVPHALPCQGALARHVGALA